MPDVVGSYPFVGVGTWLFLRARWATTPYRRIAAKLPASGRLLDLGCGHGVLALTLAAGSAQRDVLGIDHDAARVELARRAAQGNPRLRFEKGSILEVPAGPFAGIALIDVMHYFRPEQQQVIVDRAAAALAPGGTLLLREVDPDGGAVSRWNRLYERISTRLGITQSNEESLYFRSRPQWERLLESAGLAATSERCSSPLFADVLFTGTRPR